MEREITFLKTSGQKSAVGLDLVIQTVQVSIPLVLGTYQTSASGTKCYITQSDGDNIITGYLDWYTEDIQRNWVPEYQQNSVRQAWVESGYYNGNIIFKVHVDGSRSDIDVLTQGGTVVATMGLRLIGLNDFTVGAL